MFNWKFPDLGAGIFILILWEVFWKGIALWKSAKRGDLLWFIAIFLINLFGFIPIFYLWQTKQLGDVFIKFKSFFK
ncbi:hypothetical protein HYW41_00565 [Candidatus Daviesbacteria bacterium]|nr:hypothetical protein [Candidatus Daviesbacteria bacterium]